MRIKPDLHHATTRGPRSPLRPDGRPSFPASAPCSAPGPGPRRTGAHGFELLGELVVLGVQAAQHLTLLRGARGILHEAFYLGVDLVHLASHLGRVGRRWQRSIPGTGSGPA